MNRTTFAALTAFSLGLGLSASAAAAKTKPVLLNCTDKDVYLCVYDGGDVVSLAAASQGWLRSCKGKAAKDCQHVRAVCAAKSTCRVRIFDTAKTVHCANAKEPALADKLGQRSYRLIKKNGGYSWDRASQDTSYFDKDDNRNCK
jgi:hypothetical protein